MNLIEMVIEFEWRPDMIKLRVFGFVEGGVLCGIGAAAVVQNWHSWPLVATITWCCAVQIILLALLRPAAQKLPYLAHSLATLQIGSLLSWLVLAIVFYIVITPIGILQRLFLRDALKRRFDDHTSTYWEERKQVDDLRRYFRQY
jgi:hypothetical protein